MINLLPLLSPKSENDEDADEDAFDEGKVEDFYREIYADVSIDRVESQQIFDFFRELKPSAVKLVWTRAAAFRIASEFLTEEVENNVSLLRCINGIVNALERTCME